MAYCYIDPEIDKWALFPSGVVPSSDATSQQAGVICDIYQMQPQ